MTNLRTKEVKIEITQREFDGMWQLTAPASSVRIGETNRELVKLKRAVDYLRCITVFVGKNRKDCKMWLDTHREAMVKLGIPYEVGSS